MEAVIVHDFAHVNGGAGAVALASARELARTGMAVTLFTAVGPVAPELADFPNLTTICLNQQEIAHDANRPRAFFRGLWNRTAARALADLLATKDPTETVVHVHSWTKALSPMTLHVALGQGFKVALTLHDYFISCPTGGFFLHPQGTLCRKRPMSLGCATCQCDRRHMAHKLWRVARTFLQNRTLSIPGRISQFIAVSEFSARVLRPSLPPDVPVAVVRNPVQCIRGEAATVRENGMFLFVGRFAREKGVLLAAEAFRRSGVPAAFVGVGELEGQVRAICPDAAFPGWLDARQTQEWLKRARAVVFPSLWYETLGLVVLEAAAAGVPAIVSDQCAASDLVRHGSTGLHFRHGSAEDLTKAICALRDHADEAAAFGTRAYREFWDDPWSEERHAIELRQIYERMLGRSQAAHAHA